MFCYTQESPVHEILELLQDKPAGHRLADYVPKVKHVQEEMKKKYDFRWSKDDYAVEELEELGDDYLLTRTGALYSLQGKDKNGVRLYRVLFQNGVIFQGSIWRDFKRSPKLGKFIYKDGTQCEGSFDYNGGRPNKICQGGIYIDPENGIKYTKCKMISDDSSLVEMYFKDGSSFKGLHERYFVFTGFWINKDGSSFEGILNQSFPIKGKGQFNDTKDCSIYIGEFSCTSNFGLVKFQGTVHHQNGDIYEFREPGVVPSKTSQTKIIYHDGGEYIGKVAEVTGPITGAGVYKDRTYGVTYSGEWKECIALECEVTYSYGDLYNGPVKSLVISPELNDGSKQITLRSKSFDFNSNIGYFFDCYRQFQIFRDLKNTVIKSCSKSLTLAYKNINPKDFTLVNYNGKILKRYGFDYIIGDIPALLCKSKYDISGVFFLNHQHLQGVFDLIEGAVMIGKYRNIKGQYLEFTKTESKVEESLKMKRPNKSKIARELKVVSGDRIIKWVSSNPYGYPNELTSPKFIGVQLGHDNIIKLIPKGYY